MQQKKESTVDKKKMPLYLGLFAESNRENKIKIEEFAMRGVSHLMQKYNKDDSLKKLFFDLQKGNKYLQPPGGWHITALYIGNNASKLNTPYYLHFKENVSMPIDIAAIVYVPNKLLAALVFPDPQLLLVENKFPHMTLLLDEWKAVNSNDVWKALCDQGGPLFFEYSQNILSPSNSQKIIEKYTNITILNELVDAFVFKAGNNRDHLYLDAITKQAYI